MDSNARPRVIETRFLTIGRDRLCTKCAGTGAIVPASALVPARPARPAELARMARNQSTEARRCDRCDGIGLEPGSRVLDERATSSDEWPKP